MTFVSIHTKSTSPIGLQLSEIKALTPPPRIINATLNNRHQIFYFGVILAELLNTITIEKSLSEFLQPCHAQKSTNACPFHKHKIKYNAYEMNP